MKQGTLLRILLLDLFSEILKGRREMDQFRTEMFTFQELKTHRPCVDMFRMVNGTVQGDTV